MTDTRFVIKDKLASFTGSLVITDEHGQPAYEVVGSLVALGRKVTLRDLAGTDLFTVQHKVGHLHKTVVVTTGDGTAAAEVVKTLGGIHHTYRVALAGRPPLEVRGDLVNHDFGIDAAGERVARVSRSWVSARDAYGVDVADGEDVALVLAVVVAVDVIEHVLSEDRDSISR